MTNHVDQLVEAIVYSHLDDDAKQDHDDAIEYLARASACNHSFKTALDDMLVHTRDLFLEERL